ncbi:MAG: tRNA 2-thiouridine(34) synthase MnmA [Eggerthellaceae bacterium]|nr:tRNA 2-thiouridine(34) synthase MnmA [Eggerthellaceae bacterium]
MSGGVDSSVAAALLVEQGFRVVGAYMKNWTLDVPGMQCPWAEDLAYAKRTAVKLGIDLRVYDFQEAYKHDVVDYLVREYEAGRTPNPDVMCNQHVKFGLFLQTALEEGFDYVATGHYARRPAVSPQGYQSTFLTDVGSPGPQLMRAIDEHKDQTYFLYRMGGKALSRALFPLGGHTKDQVRAMAAERALPAANRPDSQGICFIGEAPIQDFLRMYVDPKPGKIIDADTRETVGAHDGALFYTIGQRKGLGVGGGQPYYVVGKDMGANVVYVSHDAQAQDLQASELALEDCTWLSGESPAPGDYFVRTRHTGQLVLARFDPQGEANGHVRFGVPQERVASGQSVVIYDGEVCLGGGIVR